MPTPRISLEHLSAERRAALRAQLGQPGRPWPPELWDSISVLATQALATGSTFPDFYARLRQALDDAEACARSVVEAAHG